MQDRDAVPALARGVRLRFDNARSTWMLEAGGRLLDLNDTALEMLRLVDGRRGSGAIARELADRFEAAPDEIAADVAAMLDALADEGCVVWAGR